MPKLFDGETKDEFISRCMSAPEMNTKHPDEAQRYAVCNAFWEKREMMKTKLKYHCKDCTHETDNMNSGDTVCPECGGELMESKGPVAEPKKEPMKLETKEMRDVEIFQAGTWKGREYSEADIDEAIGNFKKGALEPYINLNHDDDLSKRVTKDLKVASLGFVSGLRRVGDKLLADFKQVPKVIAELIQAGALKKRSVEWWSKYKHANGEFMNNVLEAVTFHGADGVPAVNTLADIANLYKAGPSITEHEGKKETVFLEDLKVGEIKIDQTEYDALKAKAEKVSKLEADAAGVSEKLKAGETAAQELARLKTEREAEKANTLKSEAEAYVKAQVEAKKLLPKFAAMKTAEYIRLKNSGDDLVLFKEEIEAHGEVINLAPVTGAVPLVATEFKHDRNDAKAGADPTARAEAAIQAVMKRDNLDWLKAAEKLGLAGGN